MKRKKLNKRKLLIISYLLPVILLVVIVVTVLYGGSRWGNFISLDFLSADLFGRNTETERTEEKHQYIMQELCKTCGCYSLEITTELPEKYYEEILEAQDGLISRQEIVAEGIIDNLPSGWYGKTGDDQTYLTSWKDVCEECGNRYYLGNNEGKIAIFKGTPPGGQVYEELDIKVKDVYQEDLDQGVPFSSPEDLENLLENFTS